MSSSSKIFAGYRALGFVSNHIPLTTRHHQKHKENYIVTCVGKAFHTYNSSKLGITSVSNTHEDEISCLSSDATYIYTANGKQVQAFSRNKQREHEYSGHECDVHLLLPFGNHLITVDTESRVKVWDIKLEESYLELEFSNKSFLVTCLMHPNTYLNKILFGSRQGSLQLWNIKTNKLVYTFRGWDSPVMCVEQAPAVDVVAVGLEDGRTLVHNLRFDETLMTFTQDWGPVTCISFRTDGQAVMTTGSTVGHVALWDLEKQKLQSQMRNCHQGSVTGMKCLPGEPLMVTSSPDNSLKVWIFDQPDGSGRLLRQRSGHSAPPTVVKFHGNDGKNIISAGQDSTLRSFSTYHDRLNKNLGRASYYKKGTKKTGLLHDKYMMPPITQCDSESSRQSDWDSIVATHRGEVTVTTWNYQRATMGNHMLKHPRFSDGAHKRTVATCVCMSHCGNFSLIGYSSGHVDMYNMQSGLHRGCYGDDRAHTGSVRGVCTDGLNQQTITAGADCCIKFWRFKSKELLHTLKLDTQISSVLLHRESSMLAVSLDDFKVVIIDLDTHRIVREFNGHTNSITSMTFSSDGRWLVTASMDSCVRTWDLPTGRLVDIYLVDKAVTSVSMSPTSDFLATSHVDDLGVYIWSNLSLYKHVSLTPLPADHVPQLVTMPTTSRRAQVDTEDMDADMAEYESAEFKSPDQISGELVTLSLLPASRWQNLLSLDIIKERNKPKEPPKVPKSAPFFLPTVAGLEPKFDLSAANADSEKIIKVAPLNLLPMSPFAEKLNSADDQTYEPVINELKEMGPSSIDAEIRSLAPEGGGSIELMIQFLKFIRYVLDSNKDFELAEAYLGLFLKIHGSVIADDSSLIEEVKQVQKRQVDSWHHLQNIFNQNLCLVNYLKSATL